MLNRALLTLIVLAVVAIGAFRLHEVNESPAERPSEALQQFTDDRDHVVEDVT